MTTLRTLSFTGEQLFQAYMGTMSDTGQMMTALSQTVGLTPDSTMSVDQDFFQRIYDVATGEKANREAEHENLKEKNLTQTKKDKNTEAHRDGMKNFSTVMKDRREALEEKMRNIGGYQFTDADLEATINEVIEDKEAFQKKHGLTDVETDRALHHAEAMRLMTEDQRAKYLNKLLETDPAVGIALAKNSEQVNQKNADFKQSETPATSQQELSDKADVLGDLDSLVSKASQSTIVQSAVTEAQQAIDSSSIAKQSQELQQPAVELNQIAPAIQKLGL